MSGFGFILGVLWRSFVFVNLYVALLVGVISFFIMIFFSFISKNRVGILFSVFIFVFSLGILRFNFADRSVPYFFESQVGQKVNLSGEIMDEPDIRETNQELTVEVASSEQKTKILITTDFDQDFKYGYKINFSGKLAEPENFTTDQGKEFDYVDYLKKDGIFYVMSYPKIQIVSSGNGNFVRSALFSAKEKFSAEINSVIREPESLLMGGLIFGEKSNFDQSLKQSFVNTGMIHVVTLSGYKVTMIAQWIMQVFSFLPKNLGLGAGILTILLFVLMTGGSATAVRAGIMAALTLFARMTGRNYDVTRALILTGVLMIFLNPFVLVFDASFQLSFLGTIAAIFLTPKIEKYFLWVTPKLGLREIISITSAIYIFILPYVLYEMGTFSLSTLPANALVMPLVPLTMIFGFLTGFAGLIWQVLAVPFGFISYIFLHYELGVINFLANLSFASLSISNFPLWLTLLIYTYFIYRIFGRNIKKFFISERKE